MNQMKYFLLGATLVLLPMLGSAAPSVPAARLASLPVAQIVERNLAARGGSVAWAAVRSLTMTGKMDAGQVRKDGGIAGELATLTQQQRKAFERQQVTAQVATKAEVPKVIQLPFKMEVERPNKLRLEIQFQDQTAVQVYDGTKGWKLRPFLGRHEVEAFTADELKTAAGEQELDGPLVNYAAKGTKVALDGTDVVNGRPAYRLKLTLKGGAQRRLWIDGESFLDAKLEGAPRRFNGRPRPIFTYFKDFKAVQGLMVPHTLETVVEGVPRVERINVEQVTLNTSFGGGHFSKPQ